jgi:leader peptidase (prepilin peptidase)/N-methyltransferase
MQFVLLMQQHPAVFYGLVALLSVCVGSFLNVVIYRLPMMMQDEWQQECQTYLDPEQHRTATPSSRLNLSYPASACPKCHHPIRWYENIPIMSWLALGGKCSACRQAISIRYPLVELITLAASLTVAGHFGVSLHTALALLLTWLLIALAGIDFDQQLLPDRLTYPLIGLGLAINSVGVFVEAQQAIWGCLSGFLCLWLVYILFKLITGKEGMGYGDFKLLAALGAWLGPMQLPLIILLSSMLGAVIGIILLKINQQNRPFAFGPFLAISGWIALLWGEQIMRIYLGT